MSTVTYLNNSYLDEAQKDLPTEDSNQQWVKDELIRRAKASASLPTDQGGYTQVDLKPAWYKTFLKSKGYDQSAPPLTSTAGAVGTAALQAGQRGAQESADKFAALPGAKAGDIMRMQQKANAAGIFGSVLGALVSKKSNDFDTQQARAVKDAEALKRNSKVGMSNNELLGIANLNKTTLRNEQLARKEAEAAARKIAEADPNSKESRDTQATAVKTEMFTPEQAQDMSKEQIAFGRTAAMQTQAQRAALDRGDYERAQTEGLKISGEERADTRRIEQEQREEYQRRLQSQAPEGMRWANDTPPPPAQAAKAKEVAAARKELISGAQEMKDIHEALGELGIRAQALGQTIDQYIGDDYSKKLLAKAKLVQQKMTTAARAQDDLGVMQQFEKAMEDSVNPTAGTIGAWFRGKAPWDAIIDYNTQYGGERLKTEFGLFDANDVNRPDNDPLKRAPSEQVTRYARPEAVRPSPGRTQPFAPQTQDFGNVPSLGTAPVPQIPADAAQRNAPTPRSNAMGDNAAGLEGTYVIEVNGQRSKPRQLTKEAYKMLIQKYGMDAVKRVQ